MSRSFKHVSTKNQNIVLEVVKRHIGKPCPSNDLLAQESGLKKTAVALAVYALCTQKILGRRTVSKKGIRMRTLTILDTGERTLPGPLSTSSDNGWCEKTIENEKAKPFKAGHLYGEATIRTRLLAVNTERVWRQA